MAGALPRAGVVAGGLAAQQATSWLPAGHLPAASRPQPATIQCRIIIPGRCRGWWGCLPPAAGHQLARPASQPCRPAIQPSFPWRIIISGWCRPWWGPTQPAKPASQPCRPGILPDYPLGLVLWLVGPHAASQAGQPAMPASHPAGLSSRARVVAGRAPCSQPSRTPRHDGQLTCRINL